AIAFSPRFVSNGMTFAQQEPSAKAPCTRTMVLIAMILLLVSKACRLNVAVVHAGHYRTGTSVRPVKQRKTSQAGSGRLIGAAGSAMSVTGLGCVKTKSDLVVMPSGRQIFAFFCSSHDHRAQNSGCGYTA